ncbi:MAG: hypothetical protein R3B12_02230 [Candidatus Saccharimonadales bacterium]
MIFQLDIQIIKNQEQSVAEILLVDSNEVTPEEAMFWRDAGLIFLKNLSKESFRLRFGSPKPEEDTGLIPVVDYFVFQASNIIIRCCYCYTKLS